MTLYGGMTTEAGTACLCDLRSDTVTQPSEGMRAAMHAAPVGDDVYGEDPTVRKLEEALATLLGKDAAVFFPTGTQSNLAAILAHCGRGDEVIVGNGYHVFCDEAGGGSVLGGVAMAPVAMSDDGSLDPEAVRAAIKVDDPHYARSRLLSLENTVGGKAISLQRIADGVAVARAAGLAVHLDGARFFNAITELRIEAKTLAAPFDTVSVCLSKGLGAPVGTVLVGSRDLMRQARRHRKILGGAMRQSGVLAAAGLYALDAHLSGLADDHARARRLAEVLDQIGIGTVVSHTNMVFLTPRTEDHPALCAHMAAAGIKVGSQSPTIRLVLHRDVDDTALDAAIQAFQSFHPKP